mmetsp:Transcript_50913/g.120950  ORF Transcript_50913/g.120950 Transcript_50913/m.120950 type:complete len:213 (-) Transcript_50913:6-644(-)
MLRSVAFATVLSKQRLSCSGGRPVSLRSSFHVANWEGAALTSAMRPGRKKSTNLSRDWTTCCFRSASTGLAASSAERRSTCHAASTPLLCVSSSVSAALHKSIILLRSGKSSLSSSSCSSSSATTTQGSIAWSTALRSNGSKPARCAFGALPANQSTNQALLSCGSTQPRQDRVWSRTAWLALEPLLAAFNTGASCSPKAWALAAEPRPCPC